MIIQSQLLGTKFFVPSVSHAVIDRPHLSACLQKSLKHSLTLISAPAGFGKTTLLSTWIQSLSAPKPLVAWLSLDGEDNDPQLFWTYVLSALTDQLESLAPLLKSLQLSQVPSLKYMLADLIKILAESGQQFVLILDDYHLITEQQVHTTLSYLIEYLPAQMHIILSTRADPPLSLSQLRARRQLLEIHTDQLRCTPEETKAFFKIVMGIQLPEETVQEVTARTEGWLVGLQLLGLSLHEPTHSATLLEEISGDQRYILDYLTEEVLRKQPQDVQRFLLCTSILERFSASLCDAVLEQTGSQQILQRLDQAHLFLTALDSKRQWYRYHALFAEALHYQLERMSPDLVLTLHYRASLWYAEHGFSTQAILHAFSAHQWQWAADLIERLPSLLLLTWGASEHELVLLRQWLEQLPMDIVRTKPRLCLACAQISWQFAPYPRQEAWLDAATATLTASLTTPTHEKIPQLFNPQARQAQENLLGEVITFRAILQSLQKNGHIALSLCQQALALLSPENSMVRTLVASAQLFSYYTSAANDATTAIHRGLQAVSLAQTAGYTALAIALMSSTAMHMIGMGQLHKAQQLVREAILLGKQPTGALLPDIGWPMVLQAEILREQNQLDAAQRLVEEGIVLCKQTQSVISLFYLLCGYAVLLRVCLSRGELETSQAAFEQFEQLSRSMEQHLAFYQRAFFMTIDQVRLWLACGELDRATQWAEMLDLTEQYGTPFAREREEVARVRVLLAKHQPALALQRLEPVLQRATAGQRWGHVIEIRLLQTLAHQMLQQETQALSILSEVIRMAQPEGYIRSFVDEGASMESLLSKLREQERKHGPTPYLDTLLAAFPQQNKGRKCRPKQTRQLPREMLRR